MPLVRGHYPVTNPRHVLLGGLTNVVNPSSPARSNLEFFGLGNLTDGALAGTGVGCFVAIPVEPGETFSKISILVGATAADTPTHSFAALYSGIATPAKIVQSTDGTSTAIAASGKFDFTIAATQITPAMAPNGFIYAEIAVTATAVNTAASISVPTAVGYQWATNGPLFFSATAGSGLNGTAAATCASPAAKAVAPIVILS